ncbi:hypothetical protein C8Q76DRAFT_801934 [Earliella scabrosa]|nr:hypothetical protein C8Q76DRAFT_801934 [Earliella scabrosa]
MCEHELIGDYYRGCGARTLPPTRAKQRLTRVPPLQHFHGRYYSGERVDCGSSKCKTSAAHAHAPTVSCRCIAVVKDRNKPQNMFQGKHPDCV